MGVRTGAKVSVCSDAIEEKSVSAATDEIWLTGRTRKIESGRETESVAEMGFY